MKVSLSLAAQSPPIYPEFARSVPEVSSGGRCKYNKTVALSIGQPKESANPPKA